MIFRQMNSEVIDETFVNFGEFRKLQLPKTLL